MAFCILVFTENMIHLYHGPCHVAALVGHRATSDKIDIVFIFDLKVDVGA
jgi:hypothetical protein